MQIEINETDLKGLNDALDLLEDPDAGNESKAKSAKRTLYRIIERLNK